MDNVIMKKCKLLNTNLSFEYSTVHAEITSNIDSVKNPIAGTIIADKIGEIIFDNDDVKREGTEIIINKELSCKDLAESISKDETKDECSTSQKAC